MTRFDYIDATNFGELEGAVEDIMNLMNIFNEWFQKSHKTIQVDRRLTQNDFAILWAEAPKYDSLLSSVCFNLDDLKKHLAKESDRQFKAYKDACKAEPAATPDVFDSQNT